MARFEIPEGWTPQAYRFALDPSPRQVRALDSHCGGARFAFNHMLAHVKAVLSQRDAERSYGIGEQELTPSQGWTLPALRKSWNQRKQVFAPWWGENSKEVYNTGLDGLARGLHAWSKSRCGERAGPKIGFPRFKSKHRTSKSIRFSTGAIRVAPDRHHVTLPVLGTIHTHESTRKLARRMEAGTAKILSATVRCQGGRWYCSFGVIVEGKTRAAPAARWPHPRVGVDAGVVDLLVVAAPDGTELERIPAPRPLRAAQTKLARLQRRAARRQGRWNPVTQTRRDPSKRWLATQAQLGRVHARTANIRRHELHHATTRLARAHQVIVAEHLNVSGMARGGGTAKRGLNRAAATPPSAGSAACSITRPAGTAAPWCRRDGGFLRLSCALDVARKPSCRFVNAYTGAAPAVPKWTGISTRRSTSPASASPPARVGKRGLVPAVGRPPTIGLEKDVEPTGRPAPPTWWGRQEASKRLPRTATRPIGRGPSIRKDRLPEK